VVDADAGVGVLIVFIWFKSCCSPRRKKIQWNLNMYLSLRPFILPQLKMTEKLVQFELTVKILHSDNPESSQKSQL